jgi:beta-lactamase regulating signal transducer with metallopeptidase domain
MNDVIEAVSNFTRNSHLAALLLDALLKSFVVLALAGGSGLIWRRASAAARHLMWFLAVASLPFLPLLSSVLPSWNKPFWSVSTSLVSGNQVSLTLELAPAAGPATPGPETGPLPADAAHAGDHQNRRNQLFAAHFSQGWLPLGFAVWSGGMMLALGYLGFGQFQLGKMSGKARRPTGGDWTRLLKETCEILRLGRPVILLQSSDHVMPLTWGWRRPVVLLPAEAAQWPEERKRIVLLHELAHVKRWDCLTQLVARVICAFYWFNPLVWLAARQMCVERERACDDLVLNGGCKASDYASHLVEIARSFRRVPQVAAIAMARSSGLEKRITAIVDGTRNRRLRSATALGILVAAGGIAICLGEGGTGIATNGRDGADALRQQQIDQLKVFSAAKLKQSQTLAAAAGEKISPEYRRFFNAAVNGDWQTVTNLFESFKQRHPQYERKPGIRQDPGLRTSYWSPVLEICLAYENVVLCDPKYDQIAVDDIINSIPAGSIYFGGTDPGRGLPTAFCKSHADADPFFTLTQNALADGTYCDYLQSMYGGKIYVTTSNDLQRCFQEYTEDAKKRLQNHQLEPGENDRIGTNGDLQISGQVAVMKINGLLTKIIFDRNPAREFYVEESFPLAWMYPYLEPHGLIMKINRQPLPQLSEDVIRQDHDFWSGIAAPAIGDWLTDDASVAQVAAFVEKVQLKRDFSGFKGDPQFVQSDYAQRMFSKFRSSIAGLYAWRLNHAADPADKERMAREADFAFRQAWALCPYSPEAVFRYVNFLLEQKRVADALLVAETAAQMPAMQGRDGAQMRTLVEQLKKFQKTK